MFVKKSIVEKWYQRDSLVYRNFSYLFVNALWEKRIPQGFTVCPYFWMSMFSLLIFRPFFVAPIKYIILPILHFFGKPALAVDEFLFGVAKRNFGDTYGNYFKGSGFFIGFLSLTIMLGMFLILIVLGSKAVALYIALSTTALGLFVFYSAASFLSLFGVIAIHKVFTKTKCKTMYYLLVWAVLFVIASFVVVPTETMAILSIVATSIGQAIVNVAIVVGHSTAWAVYGLVSLAWAGLKIVFLWKPIPALLMPWWGFLVILTIMGWVSDKLFKYFDRKYVSNVRQTNPQELFDTYRSAWIKTFIRILMTHPRWKNNRVLSDHLNDHCTYKAALNYRQTLLHEAFETMWKNELDKLQQKYPIIEKEMWGFIERAEEYPTDRRFDIIRYNLSETNPDFPKMDVDVFITILVDKINNHTGVKSLALHYRELENRADKKAEAKKTSWSHVTCLRVTGEIANTVKSVGRGIKTLGVQTATLFAYLWMLIKATKQGACPYFQFTDKSLPTPDLTIFPAGFGTKTETYAAKEFEAKKKIEGEPTTDRYNQKFNDKPKKSPVKRKSSKKGKSK